jgi:pilus assembly protein Flp/PilA
MSGKDKFGWRSIQPLGCYVRLRNFTSDLADESGQDLIEYAIVIALISLAATASMSGVATSISNAFNSVSTKVSTYTS